jgi:hypothetical protein
VTHALRHPSLWVLMIERIRAFVGAPFHVNNGRAIMFNQTALPPPGDGFWQLEANTDLWLLEDSSGYWTLE